MNISQTFNVPGVGQNKLPKWAKPACQKHKPLTYLGVDRWLFYLVCVAAVGTFNLFNSLLAGLAIFIGGFAFGQWVNDSDPEFLRILAKSERYRARYDAAKQRVPRVEVR
jgi:type IV secretory pathway TrbD component